MRWSFVGCNRYHNPAGLTHDFMHHRSLKCSAFGVRDWWMLRQEYTRSTICRKHPVMNSLCVMSHSSSSDSEHLNLTFIVLLLPSAGEQETCALVSDVHLVKQASETLYYYHRDENTLRNTSAVFSPHIFGHLLVISHVTY